MHMQTYIQVDLSVSLETSRGIYWAHTHACVTCLFEKPDLVQISLSDQYSVITCCKTGMQNTIGPTSRSICKSHSIACNELHVLAVMRLSTQ